MKSKSTFGTILLFSIVIVSFYFFKNSQQHFEMPIPTGDETIINDGEEEGDNKQKREAWFKLMHQTAPETNWKALEYETQMQRHVQRTEQRRSATSRNNEEILANGNLIGEWKERGSRNQSGSVFVTEFDPETEEIYMISAGGTLWKGALQGNLWEPINQDFQFGNELLSFIETDEGRRMVATIGEIPHYSDDDGLTWTASSGISINDSWGSTRKSIVLDDDENTIYVLSKPGYWDDLKLYKSSDNGETYTFIQQLDDSSLERFTLCNPHHSNEVYLLDRHNGNMTSIFKINQNTDQLELLNNNTDFGFGNVRANLVGSEIDTLTTFVVYNSEKEVYATTDFGENWSFRGTMPSKPWSVGIYMTPSNPDFLIYGDIECYVSPNGGAIWNKVNNWGDYYGDVEHSLHADMMYFNEFQKSTGEDFILISNHGGISVSYDYINSKDNLGLVGLNVSQYYSVRTDPINSTIMYAGSQDQGFQRGLSFSNSNIMPFDQVISGDYGHIVFSQNGSRLWTVYPGGWVTYYGNPHSGGIDASFDLESEDESVWLPPLMSKPNSAANEIYMAGGNIDGGTGSFVIKLEVQGNSIQPSQFPFNFYEESGDGKVSALKTSPLNPDRWFVATTNGRFFRSTDDGQNWDQTIDFVPNGHYLYGQTIYPSKFEEELVYLGGSGYSNPAVWKSTNGGVTFNPMNEGLPPTLVFEITANQDESMLFAATEAGPYVYIADEESWYDMSGIAAPAQTYWSVEYLEEFDIVRFGTYGRGIWDFHISTPVATKDLIASSAIFKVFPNPTTELVQIELFNAEANDLFIELSNIEGKLLKRKKINAQPNQTVKEEFSFNGLPKGPYILSIIDGNTRYSKKVILN